jgi:hypothetical protein
MKLLQTKKEEEKKSEKFSLSTYVCTEKEPSCLLKSLFEVRLPWRGGGGIIQRFRPTFFMFCFFAFSLTRGA